MRRISVAVVVLISLFIVVIPTALPLDASNGGLLRLYEVMPYGDSEGFSLFNYGTRDVDISEYYIEDGEGTIRFASSIILQSKCSITILRAQPEKWMRFDNLLIHGTNGVTVKNFQLNDKGDEIVLKTLTNEIVDVFVYGTGSWDNGWKGEPFGNINYGKIAKRTNIFDTDSGTDWELVVPGRTSFEGSEFVGMLTPFTFPESEGVPVLNALASARSTILISMYILDHHGIVSILTERLNSGVSVRILLEGSPSGGVPDAELGYMSALHKAGAEIHLMKNMDGFRRYSYLHNKYAVIDTDKVIITSENWRLSSFTDNRGWGAVIHSEEYGRYMMNVFTEDVSKGYGDVIEFSGIYGNVIPSKVPHFYFSDLEYESFPVTVSPVVGPDNAFARMNYLISSSQHRIYSEQMSVDVDWMYGNSPLNNMIVASSKGIDCRLIVDVTFDSPYDNNGNDGYFLREELNMPVKTSDECLVTGMIHNKGVIVDDTVWIGSMNWNDTSFSNNREIGVIITSAYVADVFASYFLSDWNEFEKDVKITVNVNAVSGRTVLDASGSSVPNGSVFEWDLDGDGTIDRDGMKIVVDLGTGRYVSKLMVTCPDGIVHIYEFDFIVQKEYGLPEYIVYLPIVIPCAIIIVYRIFRTLRKNDDARVP